MNAKSITPQGKRAFAVASSPKVTRRAVNDADARFGRGKRRIVVGGLPVVDAEELQMAGYFIIPLRNSK
jgi:uncharacterized protein with ACT and thioredoxin-like domain